MAKDWEAILTNWTKPPGDSEQTRCDNAINMIKSAIDADAVLKKMNIDIFVQGSYANNTNVKLNSDVDVSVCNQDYFFGQYPDGKKHEDYGNTSSGYTYSDFKNRVEGALANYFGRGDIQRGNKAFHIKPNSYRVNADAVPCFEHRRYSNIDTYGRYNYISGTEFYSDSGNRIINFPKQHIENGIEKNRYTSTQFKKVVRIFKKLNFEMIDNKIEIASKIPSFLIESLCWNTPDSFYRGYTYKDIVKEIIIHLYNSTKKFDDVSEWGEINELKYLFRDSQPWKLEEVNAWTVELWNYIGYQNE